VNIVDLFRFLADPSGGLRDLSFYLYFTASRQVRTTCIYCSPILSSLFAQVSYDPDLSFLFSALPQPPNALPAGSPTDQSLQAEQQTVAIAVGVMIPVVAVVAVVVTVLIVIKRSVSISQLPSRSLPSLKPKWRKEKSSTSEEYVDEDEDGAHGGSRAEPLAPSPAHLEASQHPQRREKYQPLTVLWMNVH